MSETALKAERFDGYVSVSEAAPRGMVQLKAGLSDSSVRAAVQDATGCDMPDSLMITEKEGHQVAWMAPDELLILPRDAAKTVAQLTDALGGSHHLALDVSDMRAEIVLEGRAVREVLAKLVPLDAAGLEPHQFRRTRLAQIPAAIWLSTPTTAHVICFRSVARYAFDALSVSARKGGEVGIF